MSAASNRRAPALGRTDIPSYLQPEPTRMLGLPPIVWTLIVAGSLLAMIEVIARFVLDSKVDLVPVSSMVTGAIDLMGDGDFLVNDLARTLLAVALSFGLAVLTGPVVAYVMWRSRWFDRALRPYCDVFYAIPIFALYPILVVLFNTGLVPIVTLAWAFGGVVVVSQSNVGFRSVPVTIDKLAKSLQMNRRQYTRRVLLPAALPDILTGVKLCLAYVIIAVLATEFILSTSGVGHVISQSYNSFSTPRMYAAILLVTVLALVVNIGLGRLVSKIDWRQR